MHMHSLPYSDILSFSFNICLRKAKIFKSFSSQIEKLQISFQPSYLKPERCKNKFKLFSSI